jgi:hypothetical protein
MDFGFTVEMCVFISAINPSELHCVSELAKTLRHDVLPENGRPTIIKPCLTKIISYN